MSHHVADTLTLLRRELLRWRDLIAALYRSAEADEALHRAAFRCLLQLNPTAARQIPLLLTDSFTATERNRLRSTP